MYSMSPIGLNVLTGLEYVAPVLSAEAGPDGAPLVLLCPGGDAGGLGQDGRVGRTQQDACREALTV